ncbi:tryptophanase [Coprothermobacter platensis]|uniref:tryptophanase n=1 Tax=Coprothermobacter platensis TaxID=108819 RepID=UPI00035E0D7A|nr:tryptophanase [Coprothermobacter platensis]
MHMPEPYRIKMVEPIHLLPKEQREQKLKEAGLNVFSLKAQDVFIDLLTDSGTNAMSDNQWAGIMMGDESYAGCRNFYNLQDTAQSIFECKYIIPTHQGRGAENLLFGLLIKHGQYVLGNVHFDTTEAHITLKGGQPVNLVIDEAYDTSTYHPFKGNVDTQKLEQFIEEHGAENIAFMLITVTCNTVGGQPVSMENIKQVSQICRRHGIKVFIDAARFAENAYFIKTREEAYKDKSIPEIVSEMFSYADGFTFSAKKDALVNIGGMIGIMNDEELYLRLREQVIIYEGFPTYGGLAGRDLEAISRGLREVLDFDYLQSRVGQVEYLGSLLTEAGIPIQTPVGGHAVFVDAGKMLPHIRWDNFPGVALTSELYLEGGVRAVEIGSLLMGKQAPTELVRLTIPRRVYTNSHMDYVAECLSNINKRKEQVRGVRITYEPPVLRHFLARFEWA